MIKFKEGIGRGLYRRGWSFPRWSAGAHGCWDGEWRVADVVVVKIADRRPWAVAMWKLGL